MRFIHAALACRSEKNSEIFYLNLLGLKKLGSKKLSRKLANDIFGLDTEFKIVNYGNNHIHFEVFIGKHASLGINRVEHLCLQVDDVDVFLERCKTLGITINQISNGNRMLTFIEDFDGNLFEIKQG